ncbi:MAG: AbrB family transcriptional regulator [Pseudomonas sp.]|uniref:AbrB family transcriptional regulator n=1 Tax=Pseudomonas abieticivorans TaxID=2931382 RepID=UPI0020BDC196|nr:AbrB family transcriptional regulator [Pseudomonas sp. PIA16]MDE1168008.1 AbrB family transcriptional regulator [Pseudomonas sp.]
MSHQTSLALRYWPVQVQWLLLILSAGAFGQLLKHFNLPAGQFVGPMLVAIGFGVSGAQVRIPRQLFKLGQGCVGLLVAHSITFAVLLAVVQSWHVMLFATVLTVLLSTLVGLGMVRYGGISAGTAAWGTSPGAASAMVSMAEDNGADGRVVATMQYVRVVCVVMIGALVSHLLGVEGSGTDAHSAPVAIHADHWLNLGFSLAVIVFGVWAGTRVPAGALLVPILLGGALQLSGVLQITLPPWLLSIAYGGIGCYIGLRFDRETMQYVWRRLPAMIGGSLMLIVLCALSAWLIAWMLGKDFLSVYLATSPGGLDSMAIIAVDTHSDVGLVLAMQTLRLFGVIFTGAYLARLIIRVSERSKTD